MADKLLKYDVAMKSTKTVWQMETPRCYTGDENTVTFDFNITDLEVADLVGVIPNVYLYMRDGSFFQNGPADGVEITGTTVNYTMKGNEGKHSGIAKAQLVLVWDDEVNPPEKLTSQMYAFEVVSGLENKVAVEVMIQDWTTLTREARTFIDTSADEVDALKGELQTAITTANTSLGEFDVALQNGIVAANLSDKLQDFEATNNSRLLSAERQLEQKVGNGVKAELEDLSANVLGAIDGTGGPFNLLSIPRNLSVSAEKTDFITVTRSKNLFDKTAVTPNSEINSSGVVVANGNGYSLSDFIFLENLSRPLYFSKNGVIINDNSVYYVYFFDEGKNYVGKTQLVSVVGEVVSNAGSWTNSGYAYVRLLVANDAINTLQAEYDGVNPYEDYFYECELGSKFVDYTTVSDVKDVVLETEKIMVTAEKTDFINVTRSKNLFDKAAITPNSEINSSGVIVYNADFALSDFITISGLTKKIYFSKNGVMINDNAVYYVYYFDEEKNYIGKTQLVSVVGEVVSNVGSWTNSGYAYVRLLVPNDAINTLQVEYDSVNPYESYFYECELGSKFVEYLTPASLSSYLGDGVSNKLYGKKLWVDGDSTVEGAGISIDPATGLKLTYAGLLATKNSMDYHNNAIGGSTIGLADDDVDGTLRHSFVHTGRYQQVPLDTDYLTLMFGWNDAHFCTLGTIDDFVETTFYGAWNIVMAYYAENYPKMKVGVIVPWTPKSIPAEYNRLHTAAQVRQAVRDIAKKWGIGILDTYNGDYPAFIDTEDGLPTSPVNVRSKKEVAFLADTVHPNAEGYKYLYPMYDSFLRKL